MHLAGSFETNAKRPVVWDFLLNPNEIGPCFPDLESLEILTPDSFKAKVKVGLSLVRGTMDFDFRIEEKVPPSSAKLVGSGRGIGSSVDIETKFTLEEVEGGTKVGWVADVTTGGIISGLGTRLLDSTSNKMISQVLENLQQRLKAKAGA